MALLLFYEIRSQTLSNKILKISLHTLKRYNGLIIDYDIHLKLETKVADDSTVAHAYQACQQLVILLAEHNNATDYL